jgi:hypothetical protein
MSIPQQESAHGQTSVWAELDALAARLRQAPLDTRNGSPGQAWSSQRLYETWLKREEWRVYPEALPLLFGIPPEHWEEVATKPGLDTAVAGLWQGLQASVARGDGPPVINPGLSADDWTVRPQGLHAWAHNGGFELAEPFDTLIGFIAKVMFASAQAPSSQAGDTGGGNDKEAVLGAALAVVATFPEQCRGQAGWIEAEAVVDVIMAKSAIWFERAPPMSRAAMVELIDKWFGTL